MHIFESEDLLLIGGKQFDRLPDAIRQIVGVIRLRGVRAPIAETGDGVIIAKVEPLFFPKDIEGSIPADGVEPGFDIVPDLVGVGEVKFEERVLHDFTRPLHVSV